MQNYSIRYGLDDGGVIIEYFDTWSQAKQRAGELLKRDDLEYLEILISDPA